jgi:hypothetical protein
VTATRRIARAKLQRDVEPPGERAH